VISYVGIGIRSDKLLVSIGYLLGGVTYHRNVGVRKAVDYRLPSDDRSNITESMMIVSGQKNIDVSDGRLT
jgi:hypothetical protein